MLRNHLLVCVLLAAPFAAVAPASGQGTPAKPPEDPADAARRAKVVAKVHDVEITIGRIEDHLARQSPLLRARYADPEQLKKLVNNMIRFELLAAEAEKRGYGKHEAVVRAVNESAVQHLTRMELDEKITPQSISQEEVKAYYDSHPEEFHRPKMVRASHILVDSEQEAKQLLQKAKKLDERGFRELAKKHSKDPETKLRGGDLRYFTLKPKPDGKDAQVHAALREAAFKLKELGDTVAKPVKVDDHYSIVRLTGMRPERHTPLEQAQGPIRTRLWRQKRKEALAKLIDELRERYKPVVKPELVDLIQLEEPVRRPRGLPPGQLPRMPPGHGGRAPASPHGGAKPKSPSPAAAADKQPGR